MMTTTLLRFLRRALLLLILSFAFDARSEGAWIGKANNEFAVDLYTKLAVADPGNLFFSPISIETALAMTYAGARGSTADQMANVLHLPSEAGDIHRDFGSFLKRLNAPKSDEGKPRGYQLSIANALWGQKGYSFSPEFVGLLEKNYGAGLEVVDFKQNAESARKRINAWVEERTRDRIKDLIGQGVLTPDTRLVLTNAIYFKGDWAAQFEKKGTHDEPFHLSVERQKAVPLMHRTGDYGYMETDELQALKLPYVGGDLSMIVILPRKVDGLPALEKGLTQGKLSKWFSGLRNQKVEVSLPRFKATTQFELNKVLSKMGMPDAFDATRADFSEMTGNRDLMISNVIHKAFVEVNEQGTEAAAATGVVMTLRAMPSEPKVFRADHPFLFVILEEKSGAILFLGRLVEPES